MATKTNYLDKIKAKVTEAVENKATKSVNGEFVPSVGKTKVRILPPKNEDQFFYATHSYNFLPKGAEDGKDTLLWTRKKYNDEKCPIDEAASQFFDSNDEKIRRLGSEIKRKRKFYFNAILVDEPDPEKKFVVLVDNTNEGKLTKQICNAMNIPLIRDTEDNWVVGEDEIDMKEDGYDLLDIEEGYDFIIHKTEEETPIGNGRKIKKANFEMSKPAKSPRALTKEEKELLDKRVDLTKHVKYVEDVNHVVACLERYIASSGMGGGSKPSSSPSPKAEKPAASRKPVEDETLDEETEDLLSQL